MGKKIDINTLSAEAREVVNQKKVSGRNKLKEWFTLLGEAAAFDALADEIKAGYGKKAGVFLILTIISFVLIFFTLGIAAVLFIPFLILTIVYYSKKKKLNKIDLTNEFREVLIPFLETISEDIQAQGRIRLELDMAGPTEGKVVRKEEIPPGRFRKVVETVWEDPWCRAEVPLVDGSRLILNIDNTFITHDRYWRNPRGKSKHKTKWKKLVVVTAGMAPDDRFDFDAAQVREVASQERLKSAEKNGSEFIRLVRKFKFKAVNQQPPESIGPDALMAMFFQLGSMLRPTGGAPQTGSAS